MEERVKTKLFFSLLLVTLVLSAWEAPIRIDDGRSGSYSFTQVRFDSTQTAYILYTAGGDVMFAKYDGETVENVGEVGESGLMSFTPWMFIDENDVVHIVWSEAQQLLANEYHIRYRTYDGTGFSAVSTIITLDITGKPIHASQPPKTDPLRMVMDSKGNMFIVYMDATRYKSRLISKYGNVVQEEAFPAEGKYKFPDVAVDDDYVHVTWQAGLGVNNPDGGYTVYWGRRENKVDGKWLKEIDIKEGANWGNSAHWPLVTRDGNGKLHFLWQDDGDPRARIVFYKFWDGSAFSARKNISGEKPEYFSNNSLRVKDKDNIFIAGHKREIYTQYAWKKNGTWTDYLYVPGISHLAPDAECADVDKSFKVAIITFSGNMNSAWLVASTKFKATQRPVPVIGVDKETVYWKGTVKFDAGQSYDPDGRIVKYAWDFGDGEKADGRRVSHAYVKEYGDMVVKLTVTDNRGAIAAATKTISVLNQPPKAVMTTQPDLVYWQDAVYFDGGGSTSPYSPIVTYSWDFGDGATAVGKTVSHPYISKYGDVQATLTVRNELGASASTSKTIKVNALYTANATVEKKNFRTLYYKRFGYQISWTANVKNTQAGYTVVKYRIMRKASADAAYTQVAEVDAAKTIYRDLSIEPSTDYTYVVCTVDAQGHVSPVDNS